MNVVPFIPAHLKELKLHPFLSHFQKYTVREEYGESLFLYPSYTAINGHGKVIGCAGVYPIGENNYQAWALLSEESGKYMKGFTRETKKFLDMFKADRVQTNVRADFEAGLKWMRLLGFKCETPEPMKKFGDDGMDYYLFARVK